MAHILIFQTSEESGSEMRRLLQSTFWKKWNLDWHLIMLTLCLLQFPLLFEQPWIYYSHYRKWDWKDLQHHNTFLGIRQDLQLHKFRCDIPHSQLWARVWHKGVESDRSVQLHDQSSKQRQFIQEVFDF